MTEQVSIAAVLSTLERIEGKVDENGKRSDERHRETTRELRELQSEVRKLRANDDLHQGAVKGVETRMGALETRMGKLEADQERAKRATDEGDHMQAAALQSAMTINNKALEQVQKDMQAERKAREAAEKARADAEAVRLRESQAQTEALRTLVGWKDARWFRTAVFVGAVAGGFVAGLIATLASRGLLHLP